MKKFIFLNILLVLMSNMHANYQHVSLKDDYYKQSLKIRSEERMEEEWYLKRIPKEYANAFLYYTQDKREMRMYFYSLMVHESCNFRYFVNKNKNGTYDYGPSQLNSANIKSEYFRNKYNPTDESKITSRYCFYMVMSINLYYDLLNRYGYDYAYYAYNGGEKTIKYKKNGWYKYSSLMKHVNEYDKNVKSLVEKHQQEFDNYRFQERSRIIKELLDADKYASINKETRKKIMRAVGSKEPTTTKFNFKKRRRRRIYKLYKIGQSGYYYVRFGQVH